MRALVLAATLAAGGQDPLTEARGLLENDRFEEALKPLRLALEANPESAEALWMMAVLHLRLGRFEDGLPYAEAFRNVAPNEPSAGMLVAAYHEARGEDAKALAIYRALRASRPDDPELLHKMALLAMNRGDLEEAARDFEIILSRYPSDPRALVPLGATYLRMGRLLEAERVLTRALATEEASPDAHLFLGAVYSALGAFAPATRHLERALELRPDHAPTLFEMGLSFARREDRPRALEWFSRARETNSADPLVWFRIAEIHRYQKSFDVAEEEYREALRLAPGLVEAREQLGLLFLEASRTDEAVELFRRLVEENGESAHAHHGLAQALSRTGKPAEARRLFERAVALDPFGMELRLHYGNFLMQQGELAEGKAQLLRFQELKRADESLKSLLARAEREPDDLEVQTAIVHALLDLGRSDEALEKAQFFLARDPARPELVALLENVRQSSTSKR